jgi:hypothetical protein
MQVHLSPTLPHGYLGKTTEQAIMTSTVPLYELCVPPLRKAMQNHLVVLKKGEQWCDENGYPHSKVLSARLAPDMHVRTFSTSHSKSRNHN